MVLLAPKRVGLGSTSKRRSGVPIDIDYRRVQLDDV